MQFVNRTQETYTLSLASKEGIFTSQDITIYLHDKLFNTYHDFAEGNYEFVDVNGTFNERFEIVYQEQSLGIDDQNIQNVVAYIHNQQLNVQSSREVEEIIVYDLAGRTIQHYKDVNKNLINLPFTFPQAVYAAKLFYTDGTSVGVKLINH